MSRTRAIGERFGAAARHYDHHAPVQRVVADRLAGDIVAAGLPASPRILEIGAGTGLLTRALQTRLAGAGIAPAWTVTDLSPAMLLQARATPGALPVDVRIIAMDAAWPALRGPYDLICGSLAMQWFTDRRETLRRLAALLAPGGRLAVSTLAAGSLSAWDASLQAEALPASMPRWPTLAALQDDWPAGGAGRWTGERVVQPHESGIDFLRGLRGLGADLPAEGARPAEPLALRRALRRFEREHQAIATYAIAYGHYRRATDRGVFVTGTGTGIGKTLVSACLVRAWDATYWKPLQTGIATEAGDSDTVAGLAGLAPERVLPPVHVLQAPLSPEAAAALENVAIDARAIALPPHGDRPLVVEGAGGLMVPIADGELMIDLVARLGLPVVLVASSLLGTINHTLLSLEALRARCIPIAGVVLSGPPSRGNADAIARHGRVRILAELPWLETPDAAAVARVAALMPSLESLQQETGPC